MSTARRARRGPPAAAPAGAPTLYARIYAIVRRIPRGRVASYGQVAALAGIPHAPRVAGYALHALPEGTPVPWHRVVAADGRLPLGKLSPPGAITQRLRLEREGVRFDARGIADMDAVRWRRGLELLRPRGSRAERTLD